jgi:membrane protein YdbS with pleckstrin-like domain
VTFRASRRLFQLQAAGWALRQGLALLGILFSFAVLAALEGAGEPGGWLMDALQSAIPEEGLEIQRRLLSWNRGLWRYARVLEWVALGFFAVNLWLSWQLLRLDWEARWYMVSEESLRIREGLLRTHERTMTVANIQNLAIRRGPLQKLLGIADLEVHTAGGGAASKSRGSRDPHDDLHVGRFRGIDDAEALRDRIQASVLRHRGSGLGDPEEGRDAAPAATATGAALLAACQEVLREARGLRIAAEARAGVSGSGLGGTRPS